MVGSLFVYMDYRLFYACFWVYSKFIAMFAYNLQQGV